MRISFRKGHFLIPEGHLKLILFFQAGLGQKVLSDMHTILFLDGIPMLALFSSLVGLDHFYLSFDFVIVYFVYVSTFFTFTILFVTFWLFLGLLGKLLQELSVKFCYLLLFQLSFIFCSLGLFEIFSVLRNLDSEFPDLIEIHGLLHKFLLFINLSQFLIQFIFQLFIIAFFN